MDRRRKGRCTRRRYGEPRELSNPALAITGSRSPGRSSWLGEPGEFGRDDNALTPISLFAWLYLSSLQAVCAMGGEHVGCAAFLAASVFLSD